MLKSSAVVLNLFYISYPFIEQAYWIYPQYTQWCSFIENTKFKLLQFGFYLLKFTFGCNFMVWFNKFTPFEYEIYTQG